MKILIFSDSHGDFTGMRTAVENENAIGKTDALIHLGDGCADFEKITALYPQCDFYSVAGNGEMFSFEYRDRPEHLIADIHGHKIYITHGHKYRVKNSLSFLSAVAKGAGCDIVLFGHTHLRCSQKDDDTGIYLFNPGSISRPAKGNRSYGILTLDENSFNFTHGEI